jgi:hypothetical protein
MTNPSVHDETDHSDFEVSTRRPHWSSSLEYLRHRIALRRQATEDADAIAVDRRDEDMNAESDEESTSSTLTISPLPMINLNWVNTVQMNSRDCVHDISLHAFLHHPRVGSIEVSERCCEGNVNKRHVLQWNSIDNITPKYVMHSMSNIVYNDDARRHQNRINVMVNNWTSRLNFETVASTIGVYDKDNISVSVLDMIVQDIYSKKLSIVFVLFEDSAHTWHERLDEPSSKIQKLSDFAKYNQRLLLNQYNISVSAYLLATSSVEAYAAEFEFEFRISDSLLI